MVSGVISMWLSVIKDMLFSKKHSEFKEFKLDAAQIKPIVSTERSVRNYFALRMGQDLVFNESSPVIDFEKTFNKFYKDLVKEGIYFNLCIPAELPRCTLMVIPKDKLTIVIEIYQRYFQSIDILTDEQLYEFADRWGYK